MTHPIASTPGAGSFVHTDLAKCESQLSDWVHCPSAKTPEGKHKIAELEARLSELRSQAEQADKAAPKTTATLQLSGLGGIVDTEA